MNDTLDNVLTIEELAIYLKISKSTLYKLVREGKIPSQKVGRHWRFRKNPLIGGWKKTALRPSPYERMINGRIPCRADS